ncbi:MAG: hypothetical protein ABJF10_15985 [Chthoniobacter sp.]|uniref:hypothetical protein n=1 Tax=Chthoniobacter sp. TaxID=2510640 RepID=UPI0032A8CC52
MNAQTAETLLRCYRPGRRADSKTEKAVRFAEEDPELKQVLATQIAFDEQIVDVVHFIKPPENLRQKLTDLSVAPRAEKTRLRKQVINPAVLTAILGLVVILGIVVFFVIEGMEKFPGREAVENMLGGSGKLSGTEFESVVTTTGQLGDWFYMRGYDGFEAPTELTALPVIGSRVFRIDGRTVAQFAVGDAKVNSMRCLIFEFHASEFGVHLPSENEWKVLAQDEWVGAVRQHGDHCFLIAFRGGKQEMEDFLKTLPPK